MAAGNRRHRITLQARSGATDALNKPLDDWADVTRVWAAITPMSGRELLLAQANRSTLSHVVNILYQARFADPKVMTGMRILYASRIFNIQASIDPDERHRELNLSCSEGLNNG